MTVAVKDTSKSSTVEYTIISIMNIRSDEGGGEGVGVGEGEIDVRGEDKVFVPVFGVLAHIDQLVGFGDLVGEFGGAIAVGVIGVRAR